MIGLTKRQTDVLDFIREYIKEAGYPPSFNEMAEYLGLRSKSGIHRLMGGLEERGLIRRLHNRARSIEIVDPTRNDLWFLAPETLQWVEHGAGRRAISRETMISQIVSDWARNESTRTRRPL